MDSFEEDRHCADLNSRFDEALKSTYQHIASVLQNLSLASSFPMVDESMVNIASWELLFGSFVTNLSLETLCDNLFKTITFGVSFFFFFGCRLLNTSLLVD